MMMLFTGGAIGAFLGYAVGKQAAANRYRAQIADYAHALNNAECELAAAEKQLNAQERIYKRFEQRLIQRFDIDDEVIEIHTPAITTLPPTKPFRAVKDGVLMYEAR